jgi:hypothetical protein
MSFPKRLFEPAAVPDGAVLSRDESKSLIDRVVKMSRADSVQVNIGGRVFGERALRRQPDVHRRRDHEFHRRDSELVRKKHSVVTINDVSDAALQRAVKQSEDLAKLAPDDPEAMPALPQQTYQDVNAYFDSTANLTPADRAKAALSALDPARKAGGTSRRRIHHHERVVHRRSGNRQGDVRVPSVHERELHVHVRRRMGRDRMGRRRA